MFQVTKFPLQIQFLHSMGKIKFQAPQVAKTQARLPELSNYEKITL